MEDVGQAIQLHPAAVFYNWPATMDDALGDRDAAQQNLYQADRIKLEDQ
jgi:hypothetical protein